MNRFTIFTIILVVSIVTVVGDLVIRGYLNNEQTSILTLPGAATTPPAPQPAATSPTVTAPVAAAPSPTPPPAELSVVFTEPPAPTITSDIINQAGFKVTFKEEHFDGKIFKLLDISKFPVEALGLYELLEGETPIAAITEISLPDEIQALQMYLLLQNKTKPYIDLSLNETNAYGDRSFYINHAKKPDEAFLTVKMGKKIYAFAYVKLYHPQLKELIRLLYG